MSEFLKQNGVLTLGTFDTEAWVCTLYYGCDEEFDLYLVTDPDSVHGRMIAKKFYKMYVTGFPGAEALRMKLMACHNLAEVEKVVGANLVPSI